MSFEAPNQETTAAVQSALLEQLVDCFEQVFQIERVTPEDDFFELGGDSLAAAQLLVEIEKRFGVRLSSTLLIEYPVVSALATAIEQDTHIHFEAAVLPIKSSGRAPPLYMPHGHSGNLWIAYNLARYLVHDQPLCGISPNLNNVSFTNFQQLAEQCVNTLISEDPRQAYQLIGYSFGGILAYEMARQLLASGKKVTFLGIIDASPDHGPDMRRQMRPGIREKRARLKERYRSHGLFKTIGWAIQLFYGRFQIKPLANPQLDGPTTKSDFEEKALSAFLEYMPGQYSGDLAIFVTDQHRSNDDHEIARKWGELVGGKIEVIPVKGDHNSIGRSPHIRQIAERLNMLSKQSSAAVSRTSVAV